MPGGPAGQRVLRCARVNPWFAAGRPADWCLPVAMSVLALPGIRAPLRMLPILLLEVAWKLIWLGVVALPLWSDNALEGATRVQAAPCSGW